MKKQTLGHSLSLHSLLPVYCLTCGFTPLLALRGVAKKKTNLARKQALLAFLVLTALNVYLSLCFHVKFSPDFSSLSASEIAGSQPLATFLRIMSDCPDSLSNLCVKRGTVKCLAQQQNVTIPLAGAQTLTTQSILPGQRANAQYISFSKSPTAVSCNLVYQLLVPRQNVSLS